MSVFALLVVLVIYVDIDIDIDIIAVLLPFLFGFESLTSLVFGLSSLGSI